MWYQVTPVLYRTERMRKSKLGLLVHRRKTNSFIILDKDLNKVKGPFASIESRENSRGNAYFNLNPRWLPYQK